MLIVDLKTGLRYQGHADDLRFYALVETLRIGVPPFRVATFYLDTARWEPRTSPRSCSSWPCAARSTRVIKLAELRLGEREPRASQPGPAVQLLHAASTTARDRAVGGNGGVARPRRLAAMAAGKPTARGTKPGTLVHLPRQAPDDSELPDPRLSDVDEWGRSENIRGARPPALRAASTSNWFRVEWEGLEKIPDRRRRPARGQPRRPPSRPTRR